MEIILLGPSSSGDPLAWEVVADLRLRPTSCSAQTGPADMSQGQAPGGGGGYLWFGFGFGFVGT